MNETFDLAARPDQPRRASELYPNPLWSNQEAVEQLARTTDAILIDDEMAAVNLGISLRDRGHGEAARLFLVRLCQSFPSSASGWFELAVIEFGEQQYELAVRHCRRALDLAPGTERFVDLLTKALLCTGASAEALDAAQQYRVRSARDSRHSDLMNQFASFVASHPRDHYIEVLRSAHRQEHYVGHELVEERLQHAIQQRTPFCLVRLGDGEGAWLRLSANDDSQYSTLYNANRREFLRIWFGSESAIDDAVFWETTDELCSSLGEVDIVGITYPNRLIHEYSIMSSRGVPSCVNVIKRCQAHLEGGTVCTHDIHLDLQITGAFSRLLRNHPDVALVTCHPGLAQVVREATGAQVSETLLIPGEHDFRDVLAAVEGQHFPGRFLEVRQTISNRSQSGRLFLIAAGILGKLYCLDVKRAGGIALDIGSVADGWMGRVTRPTLHETERFKLSSNGGEADGDQR